jgi:two-component system, OmpR family, osmolarity sensor histidine kinase EnvZ
VTLYPRSLFGRLALLLLVVVAISLLATIFFFRQDRVALLARAFGDTKIAQLQAVRAAVEASDVRERRETLSRIGREYDVRIVPEDLRPNPGGVMPLGPAMRDLESRLREQMGEGTELRVAPGRGLLFVRVVAGGTGYWIGFPLPRHPSEDEPIHAIVLSLALAAVLLGSAFLFARYIARPLRDLNAAVERVGRGEMPPPLPESGPSEIATLNRGFNVMTQNLRQLEQDRALLLAGVSHDLRTPLARLRLGIEMDGREPSAREGMVDDIEEMDRIIGQFLDFARGDHEVPPEPVDPNMIVQACVERYHRAGDSLQFRPGSVPMVRLRTTAFSRLVANLIDNALSYGAPPVEVTTSQSGGDFVLEVADRGPGIAPGDVDRVKQPFSRGSAARSDASGIAGAGLGLAIVERIARMHGGRLDLLPREGGGNIARVAIPVSA